MCVLVLLAAGAATVPLARTSRRATFAGGILQVHGHGYGHGRGMGQWGAYGYARQGWTVDRILTHYYSGVTFDTRPDTNVRVRVDTSDPVNTVVSADLTGGGFSVWAALTKVADSGAACVNARAVSLGAGAYRVDCQALFSTKWKAVRWSVRGPVMFLPKVRSDNLADNLQLFLPEGRMWVRGDVWASFLAGRSYAISNLSIESYLRSSIALEMSPSWGSSGGIEALKAQAIAARSYAFAAKAAHAGQGYDVCSSTCQSYGGRKLGAKAVEDPQTDAAVAATTGWVLTAAGAPILAEYSSSTGGFSTGGASGEPYLAPVPDDGDAIAGNTHHDWAATVTVAAIEAKFPAIGSLAGIDITGRSGNGDLGGRVTSLVLKGTAGSVTLTGKQFTWVFGLQSDWFAIAGATERLLSGYFALGSDGGVFTFGTAHFVGSVRGKRLPQPIVGVAGTQTGSGYWLVTRDGGMLAFGDARLLGSMTGNELERPIVGIAATPSGQGYWLVASDGGIFSFGDAVFQGSTGGVKLAQPIVAMAVTPSGKGYWLLARDGGVFAFGDAPFLGSMGGVRLNRPATAIAATPSGKGYWLLAADGGVFSFGDARFRGSPSGQAIEAVGLVATSSGAGYLVAASNGSAYRYGDAPELGAVRDGLPRFAGRVIGIAGVRGGT